MELLRWSCFFYYAAAATLAATQQQHLEHLEGGRDAQNDETLSISPLF